MEVDPRTGVVGKNGEDEVLVGDESLREGVAGENQLKSCGSIERAFRTTSETVREIRRDHDSDLRMIKETEF